MIFFSYNLVFPVVAVVSEADESTELLILPKDGGNTLLGALLSRLEPYSENWRSLNLSRSIPATIGEIGVRGATV
jgi:hypothetical protein